jgi:hypothetical protein
MRRLSQRCYDGPLNFPDEVMLEVPEAEARALFSAPLFCVDADDWVPYRTNASIQCIECGLLDANHARVGLQVQLLVQTGRATRITTYKFSVFQNYLGGLRRAYQLDVRQLPKLTAHNRPHRHMGTARTAGDDGWLAWNYADALAHFCMETNISFQPPVPDPAEFRLRP